MKEHNADVLIIGQGLAGSVLAATLLARGCNVHVMDDQRGGSASRVAAGMFNPVSFRRIIPVWRASEVMESMKLFYQAQEKFLNVSFFHEVPLVKIFPNVEYAALWLKRIDEGMPWIHEIERMPNKVKAPFGAGVVSAAGYVDLPVFLNFFSQRLSADGRLHRTIFNEENIAASDESVVYKDDANGLCINARKLVLATGTFAMGSELLGSLPLQQNKGEVLTLRISDFTEKMTLNNGKWLLPIGSRHYRLGASYAPGVSDYEITEKVGEYLLDKFRAMTDVEFEVTRHDAGIRPTVRDRRPLLGRSSQPSVYHFNGMGTRGVLNAPLLARWMSDFLLDGQLLPDDVCVDRFEYVR